jgi:hypothetical protein
MLFATIVNAYLLCIHEPPETKELIGTIATLGTHYKHHKHLIAKKVDDENNGNIQPGVLDVSDVAKE